MKISSVDSCANRARHCTRTNRCIAPVVVAAPAPAVVDVVDVVVMRQPIALLGKSGAVKSEPVVV